jgi:hypothetical protein
MNANLTKYLSDVFRNEVEIDATSESQKHSQKAASHLRDQNTKQFILDKRFSLRLDEII